MSGVSHRLSIDQNRALRIIRIIQGFPLLKPKPFGHLDMEYLSEDQKAKAVAKIISDFGDRLSKQSSDQILQCVNSGSLTPQNKLDCILNVLMKHFPHLRIPEASEEVQRDWETELYGERVQEYIKQTPGLSEEGLSVKDSLAYEVLVGKCGVPSHIAELFLYRVKIGDATYTFIGDPHGIEQLEKCCKILKELACNKKCVFSAEDQSLLTHKGFLLSLEGNSIHHALRGFLSFFKEMRDKENDHRLTLGGFVNLMLGVPVVLDLWSKLSDQVSTNVEYHILFSTINSILKIPESLNNKIEKIFKLGTKTQWLAIFKGLVKIALKEEICDPYRSSAEAFLKDPSNESAWKEFCSVSLAFRDEVMAKNLFACKSPGERIVFLGYKHIPGVVAHLKTLAKSSPSVVASSKPDDKKSSDKAASEKDVPSACAFKLEELIPDTAWSKNAKANKVWFEGTETKTKEIAEYLSAHGIKVGEPSKTKNSTYIVIISNPDFSLIEKLPPYEQWRKKSSDIGGERKEGT